MKLKIISAVSGVLLTFGLFAWPVVAVPGDVGGSFSVGGVPTVTVAEPGLAMTPMVEQTVTVHVDMGPGVQLTSLTGVTLKVWYDANGGATNITEFDAATPDVHNCAVITWNTTAFSLTPAATSWALGDCLAPTLTSQFGDFSFLFTPGKVAQEASSSAIWQAGATAATATFGTGFGSDATPIGMNLYQQLAITGTPSLSWGSVAPGMVFADSAPSRTALGQPVTIISNTGYKLNGQSTASWTSSGSPATLDPTGATGSAQEFSLEVDNDTTMAGSVLLAGTATQIKTGTITSESGDAFSSINVWLKLASTFAANTYNGTVNFSVSH